MVPREDGGLELNVLEWGSLVVVGTEHGIGRREYRSPRVQDGRDAGLG
jgi:hypothetical protein